MCNTNMNLQTAIDRFNDKNNLKTIITDEINKLTEDFDFEVVKNDKDNDLRISLLNDSISTSSIENLQKKFKITYINIQDHTLELDLELKK
jgi:hypothetical protein